MKKNKIPNLFYFELKLWIDVEMFCFVFLDFVNDLFICKQFI